MKIKYYINEISIALIIFVLNFIWVNYYKRNFSHSLPIAIFLTIIFYMITRFIINQKNKRRNIDKEDKKIIELIKTQLLLNPDQTNYLYLKELFNIKCKKPIVALNNKKYYVINFIKKNIDMKALSKAIEITNRNNLTNCIIVCENYDIKISNFASTIINYDVKFFNINDLYYNLIKPQNFLPKSNFKIKEKNKHKFKELISIAFNEKNFETFKEELANSVKERLDTRGGDEYSVTLNKVDKANETYDAVTVKPENSNIGVNISV